MNAKSMCKGKCKEPTYHIIQWGYIATGKPGATKVCAKCGKVTLLKGGRP